MTARGEVQVTVSFGPTSSPGLAHAVAYAIEHAQRTEQLRSGTWEATFRIEDDEGDFGAAHHLLRLVQGWKTTRIQVNGSVDSRHAVRSMLGCAREWLLTQGRCGARFPSTRGAPRCRVCPLYDASYAAEFWVPTPFLLQGADPDEVPDHVPQEWMKD